MLEIKDLSVSFLKRTTDGGRGIIRAVSGANLKIEQGSFTALVGESGSGKSVTALSICRLISPLKTTGSILWGPTKEQKDLLKISETELLKIRGRQIGFIFQDPASSLNPVIKVGPQIAEAYLAHFEANAGEAKQKALALLGALKIYEPERFYRSYPHELSGGMKQRAMIAMALITGPRLLIADEPTTALDVSVEAEILKILTEIQKERLFAIFFITHNLNLAVSRAQTVYVMQKSSVIECLERKNNFCAREEYTQRLFAADLYRVAPKSYIGV